MTCMCGDSECRSCGTAQDTREYSPYGLDLFGQPIKQNTSSPVARKFIVAPFSVLSAREGEWQKRKRAWLSMGIKGEEGRDAKAYQIHDWIDGQGEKQRAEGAGVSIFDPVMCELAYRWWCPEGGQVVDPFAGGSVRGVVASALGRKYWGGEIRLEQVEANRKQAQDMCPDNPPVYVCGDSMDTLASAPPADFIFSCPPYGDLEKYSDDPADLSSMDWPNFARRYRQIIHQACQRLKPDRFACFVVGDFRDKRGFYRDFVGLTVSTFRNYDLPLYNEAILVTAVGSAPIRVTKQFEAGRKLVKTHQNVLVFCKGDWKKATEALKI